MPANRETKEARIRAHDAFDVLWKGQGRGARRDAYRWLTASMGRTGQVHIGEMTVAECEQVIQLCRTRAKEDEES